MSVQSQFQPTKIPPATPDNSATNTEENLDKTEDQAEEDGNTVSQSSSPKITRTLSQNEVNTTNGQPFAPTAISITESTRKKLDVIPVHTDRSLMCDTLTKTCVPKLEEALEEEATTEESTAFNPTQRTRRLRTRGRISKGKSTPARRNSFRTANRKQVNA